MGKILGRRGFWRVASLFFLLGTLSLGVLLFWERTEAKSTEFSKIEDKAKLLEGRELRLVGVALHSRFFFPVYRVSLYLSRDSEDAREIIDHVLSPGFYAIAEMSFFMELSTQRFGDAWKESYFKNCQDFCEESKDEFFKLLSHLRGFKRGEKLILEYYPDHVNVLFNGLSFRSESVPFARALLLTWLGDSPPSQSFKEHLLGHR